MIPASPDEREDSFIELLAAADDALAAGETPRFSDSDPDLRDRFERGMACMRVLRERRSKSAPAPLEHLPDSLGRIGRFQIKRELGRGGFGVVLLAYDTHLNRDVALKVPRADAFVTPELRERFEREARAAASLDHPSIVPVYEAGELGPVCYIASAYCPGITLADWLRQRKEPVPFADAATMVARLADAVEHAHGRGILHRDLKPSNILLQVEGVNADLCLTSDCCPKITDFGLAKLLDVADGPSNDRTRTGTILGTPSYMAPEQAEGHGRALNPSTDVYALGAILYELLTGRPPFRGESELDTLMQVRGNEPVAPSRLRPKTPRDLETICLKCLRKEPARRYSTAGELSADLGRWLRNEPICARPVRAAEKAIKWAKRRPMVAALTGALVLSMVSAFVVVTMMWRQADQARAAAEGQLAEKLTALAHRHSMANEMTEAKQYLEQVPPQHRGPDWRYVYRVCHAEVGVLRSRAGLRTATLPLVYSPNGARIAALDGLSIQIWDATTGQDLLTIPLESDLLPNDLAYSEDGTRILLAVMNARPSQANPVRHAAMLVFDAETGAPLARMGDNEGFASTVVLSGDGRRCATSEGGRIQVWDIATTQRLATFGLPSKAVSSRNVLDQRGMRVAIRPPRAGLEIWNTTTGTRMCALPPDTIHSRSFAFSPDATQLAVADSLEQDSRGRLRVWQLADQPGRLFSRSFSPQPNSVAFTPDGQRLAVGLTDNSIWIGDARTGQDLIVLRGHNGPVFSVVFSPDGRRLASRAKDGTVRIWDVTPWESE